MYLTKTINFRILTLATGFAVEEATITTDETGVQQGPPGVKTHACKTWTEVLATLDSLGPESDKRLDGMAEGLHKPPGE